MIQKYTVTSGTLFNIRRPVVMVVDMTTTMDDGICREPD
jgi:hypothetical protein